MYLVHPCLDLMPLFTGMRKRSTHSCITAVKWDAYDVENTAGNARWCNLGSSNFHPLVNGLKCTYGKIFSLWLTKIPVGKTEVSGLMSQSALSNEHIKNVTKDLEVRREPAWSTGLMWRSPQWSARKVDWNTVGSGQGKGGTQPILGNRWAVDGLKPWPCSGEKNPKILTLFRTKDKIMHAVLF